MLNWIPGNPCEEFPRSRVPAVQRPQTLKPGYFHSIVEYMWPNTNNNKTFCVVSWSKSQASYVCLRIKISIFLPHLPRKTQSIKTLIIYPISWSTFLGMWNKIQVVSVQTACGLYLQYFWKKFCRAERGTEKWKPKNSDMLRCWLETD